MDNNTPLLTLAQVHDWESRVIEIDESIRAQTEERAILFRKIEAAKVFMEFLPPNDDVIIDEEKIGPSPGAPAVEGAEESISGAVLAAMSSMKGAPKAATIRRWIKENNAEVGARLDASPAYLYTALMRHVRAGRLAKRGKGYRLPAVSPKGETGGDVTPSGGLNRLTPNKDTHATANGMEAGGI